MSTRLGAYHASVSTMSSSCGCIGPQNGEPYCPCQMRGPRQADGRWVKDMGPVDPHRIALPKINRCSGCGKLGAGNYCSDCGAAHDGTPDDPAKATF
jgi:hypothetical protein